MGRKYYPDSANRPRIVLPPVGYGKVIQVKIKEPEEFLFIGWSFRRFHSEILKGTLERFGLECKGKWVKDYPNGKRLFKPDKEGDNYILFNAGTTRREEKNIYIGGSSLDYGILFEEKHLEKVRPHLPEKIKFIYELNPFGER